MSNRALGMLLGVVGFLALGSFGLWFASRPARAARLWAAGLPAKADRLDLEGPSGKLSFSRAGSTWRMDAPLSYAVDSGAIQTLLEKLPEVQLSDELSADPARYALFGVDDSSATRVRVASSAKAFEPLEFYVGKEGSDYSASYLRFPGRPGVVEGSGMTASGFAKSAGDWLDKALCAPPLGDVDRLSVRAKEGAVSLKSDLRSWRAGGSKAALSSAAADQVVRPAVDAVKGLIADKILLAQDAPKAAVAELARPEMALEAHGAGRADSCSLKLGRKDSTGFRLAERVGESRLYFQLYDWRLDPFRKKELLKLR